MATFADQIISDVSAVFFNTAEFASTCTYVAKGGGGNTSSTKTVMHTEDVGVQGDNKTNRTFHLVSAEFTTAPLPGDEITYDSRPWTVVAYRDSNGVTEVRCVAPELMI